MIKELKYDLTKEDIAKSVNSINKRVPKILDLIDLIIGLCLITIGIFFKWYLYSVIVLILCIILLLLISGKINYIIFFAKFKTQKINVVINSDENTFTGKSDVGTSVFNWNKIPKIDNTKDSILIFINDNSSLIIPKRIFESEQEMNETWELIQECYNKYKVS